MTLAEQLACVEREIKCREQGYPRWVPNGYMIQQQLDDDLARMRALAERLRGLIDEVNMNEERLP